MWSWGEVNKLCLQASSLRLPRTNQVGTCSSLGSLGSKLKIYKCERTEINPLALMRFFGSRMASKLFGPPSITHSYLVFLMYQTTPYLRKWVGDKKKPPPNGSIGRQGEII